MAYIPAYQDGTGAANPGNSTGLEAYAIGSKSEQMYRYLKDKGFGKEVRHAVNNEGGDLPTKSSMGFDGWEHTVGPVLSYLGDNNIATRAKFQGATPGTSLASKTLSKALPQKLTKVLGKEIGTKVSTIIGTNTIGRALGRFVPIAGWALTVYDFGSFLFEHEAEIQRGMEDRNRWIQEGVIPFR